jgi:hypothetical protein
MRSKSHGKSLTSGCDHTNNQKQTKTNNSRGYVVASTDRVSSTSPNPELRDGGRANLELQDGPLVNRHQLLLLLLDPYDQVSPQIFGHMTNICWDMARSLKNSHTWEGSITT